MAERIAVGDFVRFSPTVAEGLHPRATDSDIGPNTSPFVVTAYDKVTKMATLSRQGRVHGVFAENHLIKVDAPVDNTQPEPPVTGEPPPPDPNAPAIDNTLPPEGPGTFTAEPGGAFNPFPPGRR